MLIIISSSYHPAYILTGPLCGISTPPLPLVFFSSSSSLPSLSTIVLSLLDSASLYFHQIIRYDSPWSRAVGTRFRVFSPWVPSGQGSVPV